MRSRAVWVSTVPSSRLSLPTDPELRSSAWRGPMGVTHWILEVIVGLNLSTGCGYSKRQVNSRRSLDGPNVSRTRVRLPWTSTASWGPVETLDTLMGQVLQLRSGPTSKPLSRQCSYSREEKGWWFASFGTRRFHKHELSESRKRGLQETDLGEHSSFTKDTKSGRGEVMCPS